MNVINVTPGMSSLLLGKQGENKSTKFLFDVSGWLEEYPGCTITLVNRRPYESVSYPCVLTTEDDGKRGWVINSADLAKDGDGEAELKCTLGDMIEKERKTWKTKIVKSLSGEGDAPEPWESMMDDIEALVGDAQDARDDAGDAAEDSEAYAVGKRGGEDVGSTDPAYHNNSKYYAEQAAALLDTKADKVSGATNGNLAGLDSNGNLMDSGKKPADFYELPGTGIPKSDLSSGVQSSLELADSAYQKPGTGIPAEDLASGVIPDVSGYYTKPSGGIPKTDLASEVQTSLGKADTAYQKDSGGIPSTDMTTVVQTSLGKADTAYQKPSGGIPSSDMATAVQTSLGKADTAYQKPGTGIPASDIESGVIPVMTDLIDDTSTAGTDVTWSAKKISDEQSSLLTEITNTEDTVKRLDLIDFVARDHLTISGYYLTSTGKKTDNSSYSISPFIPVKQGTIIKFGMYASSFMSVFAYYTTNEEGQNASYVKAGTGTAGFTEGEYTAPGNGYIRFCSNHTKSGEYLYFDNIKSDIDRVTSGAIETEVAGIKQKTDQITLENTYEYTQLADFGRENTSNTYTTYHQIDETDGSYISTQFSTQRACETYFEIPSGCVIFNYLTNQDYTAAKVRYCYYDTNKTYLGADKVFKVSSSNVHDATYAGKLGTWVTYPSNAKYVRIWDESGNFHALALSVATITNTRITNFINKHLDGKKILAFGDSIWGNDRYNGIADFLAQFSGATVYNGAVGGTRITDLRTTDSPAYLPFDGVKLVHALMTNTWTDQDENASSVISYVETQTLPMLKALDVSTIDIITLAYGHNDITANETVAQVQTALDTIIHDILSHYPSIRILVITPPWRMFSSDTVDGDDYTNSQSVTLRSLADGLISEATAKHIASLDMLGNAPICADTKDTYMDSDHVHLNATGNALYAHIVNGKLRSMF